MDIRKIKDFVFETTANIGQAMSNPIRLQLLDVLCQGEKTVEELAESVGARVNLTSTHLKLLRNARLVETRKEGKYVFYRIADSDVAALLVNLRGLAEKQFSEIEYTMKQYFDDPSSMVRIDRKTLLKRARDGDIVVLDVRPEDEYRSGHIPGAISVPISELKNRLSKIPRSKEIIAYCRGPYCVFSHEAVAFLKKRGYRATRLSDGVAEWAAASLPLVTACK